MCGLVGRAGRLKNEDERVFKVMLLLDYFRGQDSTGIAVVSKKGAVNVLKVADDPIILMQHSDFDNTMIGSADAIWIGHNRAATVGATTRANAHPFQIDHITGVHNGTLDKASFLEISMRMADNYETDSETIFAHIAKYGVEETIPRLQGAWALVWYDENDQTLNMIKNDKRPLFTCQSDRGSSKILTWASEWNMIAAARVMAKTEDGKLVPDEGGFGYWPLPNDTLHTWNFQDLLDGNLDPTTKPLKGRDDPVINVTYPMGFSHNGTYIGSGSCTTGGSSGKSKSSGFSLVEDDYQAQFITAEDQEGLVLGVIEQGVWDDLVRFGCSVCCADINAEQPGLCIYVNEGTILCADCSGETETLISNAYGMALTDRIIG